MGPILNIFMHIPNYFHVCLYLYLTYLDIFSCIFIPIFMYISTYFYIFLLISTYLLLFSTYLCIFLLISTYFYIFSAIFMYISTYFHVYFYLFLHIYHKSVLFYYRLPQKCVVLLQIATKVWYFTTVYRYLPHKCGLEMYLKMRYKQTMYLMYLR